MPGAFPSWLWPSDHNDHTGWKTPDVQKQPTIFWGLPDSMVNPAALQKSQAVPRNVRVIATVGGEKLQQKDWTGVQQQGSLSVPVKKLMEIREKVIELARAGRLLVLTPLVAGLFAIVSSPIGGVEKRDLTSILPSSARSPSAIVPREPSPFFHLTPPALSYYHACVALWILLYV